MDVSYKGTAEQESPLRVEPALARNRTQHLIYTSPLWLFIMFVGWILVFQLIRTDPEFTQIYNFIDDGILTTLQVSFFGYLMAIAIGLTIGIIRSSPPIPPAPGAAINILFFSYGRLLLYNIATLYVQLLRGLPMLVVVLLGAFTVIPFIENLIRTLILGVAAPVLTNTVFIEVFVKIRALLHLILLINAGIGAFLLIVGLAYSLVHGIRTFPNLSGLKLLSISAATWWHFQRHLVAFYSRLMDKRQQQVTRLILVFTVLPLVVVVIVIGPLQAAIKIALEGDFQIRGASVETGFLALGLAYGAFLSETFRAGIQSVDKGQLEAARSLGMTPVMTMRHIVLPQAIRSILPPLGNDMIAMIKDSSLVSALGVKDITRLAINSVGGSFKYPETYLVLSMIYLTMTVIASLLVRAMERRLKAHER